MKHLSIPTLALAAGLALVTAACSNNADTADSDASATTTPAGDATVTPGPVAATDSHAAQFLGDAIKGDNSEIKLGQLAAEKGSSDAVKTFGQMLVTDHGKAKDEAGKIATAMNVPIPTETKPEADAEYAKLQGMTGAAFDKEFASFMVDDHKKAIAMFEQEAASSDPAQVTALATKTLPTLKAHLAKAQSLQ
jgi:putative membrane protein